MSDVFGKKLGQYILLEQLGEGGMAKVYNALDSRVDRNVAIKVILPSKRTSSVFLQSFEREAKVLAKLTHTNIVKVLNYGVENGQPYLVMEYVAGGTLKEAMNQKLPWQTAAAILAPIARALDYVHQQQVVHRDVKPSNILLQEDFTPMLSDFGILQLLESKDEKVDSAIGSGIGTPEYMPPEQGMGKDVDFRADIYSLGLVFYEMITGQKPYTADSPMAMVIKHVTDQMPLPTSIDKNIPKFVERAILRAVQKDPKRRFMSMGQFADVLELIALGDKASPKKINKVASAREKRQLSSFIIVALSILLVILTAGTSLFTYNYFKRQQQANAMLTAAALTAQITPTARVTPTSPAIQTEVPATEPSVVTPVSSSLDLTLLGTPIASNRSSQYQEIARWGIGGVNVVEWSPDGKTIALGTTSGIFLYDAETKESTLFIDTQFNVVALTFNPAGGELTAGSPHGIVQARNTETGSINQTFTYARPNSEVITNDRAVMAIAYSSGGEDIAVGYRNGAINYFPSHQVTSSLQLVNYPTVEDLAISSNKQFIYASNGSQDVFAWEIQFQSKTSLTNRTPVNRLSLFSGESQFLLAGGSGNSVYLWDLNESDPKLVSSFTNLGGHVTDIDLSQGNRYVAIGLNTGIIKVYEIPGPEDYSKTLQPMQTIAAYQQQIRSVAFSPTELVIASGNHEEGLKLWDAQSGKDLYALNQSMSAVDEMYFSSDGKWLATSHEDRLLRVWDVNAGKKTEYSPMEGYLPKGVPFSPDNRFLAFIYSPGRNQMDVIQILDLEQGKIIAELPNYTPKSFVQFSPDSNLLAMGNAYSASLWDVSTWEQVDTRGGPNAGCGQYFTPQNTLLTMISDAGIIFSKVFDEKMQKMCGTELPGATLVYYFYEAHKMVFVLGNETGEVWIWGFSGSELSRKGSSTPYPLSSKIFLAADQSSGWYAYVTRGAIIVKNINGATGTTIDEQTDYQYRVALLPDKKLMALGSRYGSIHIWTMP